MPDPECWKQIGDMAARIEALEEENADLQRQVRGLLDTKVKIGGAVWALSVVIGSAFAAIVHLFDIPALVKRLVAM